MHSNAGYLRSCPTCVQWGMTPTHWAGRHATQAGCWISKGHVENLINDIHWCRHSSANVAHLLGPELKLLGPAFRCALVPTSPTPGVSSGGSSATCRRARTHGARHTRKGRKELFGARRFDVARSGLGGFGAHQGGAGAAGHGADCGMVHGARHVRGLAHNCQIHRPGSAVPQAPGGPPGGGHAPAGATACLADYVIFNRGRPPRFFPRDTVNMGVLLRVVVRDQLRVCATTLLKSRNASSFVYEKMSSWSFPLRLPTRGEPRRPKRGKPFLGKRAPVEQHHVVMRVGSGHEA